LPLPVDTPFLKEGFMRINSSASPHVGPTGSGKVPKEFLSIVEAALAILKGSMRNDAACNSSFAGLSGGQTFKQFFDDPNVWMNYDPINDGKLWGWTQPSTFPKDIVVTRYALKAGRWSVAATIVHELAHLNGAPGGASKAAELRVKACHLQSSKGPYDPAVQG
jgi:hypothetical protein